MSSYPEFLPFNLLAFLSGTLIYAFQEFYIVMSNVVKFDDGLTGYMNYGLWQEGKTTSNPSGELVKAVLRNIDPSRISSKNGEASILEIGCGLGQPAIDAAHHFGPEASITGVSINSGHVARANNLAKSNSMSSRVSHHFLNATEVHTLPERPFAAAYSVEVLSEIPDPALQNALTSIHEVLLPGAQFVFADIVRKDAKSPSGKNDASHDRESSWSTRHLGAKVVTKLWGDDWRSLSTLEKHLSKSGFDVISTESIGDRVFIPTWIYAKQRILENPSLGMSRDVVGRWSWIWSFIARSLTKASLRGLALLWESGEIDYVIIKARRN